jgi:hypothetical protein
MTSFLLRESIFFTKENNAKLLTCFLDAKQAFDRVSHPEMMLKLYNTDIDNHIFKIIYEMFRNVQRCVRTHGHTSDWFQILQGTRQGQCTSPFLYSVFIDGLINKLESSSRCLSIDGVSFGCPTSSDDMVLLSLTKTDLNSLINTCYEYSTHEQYLYNAKKSNIVVFNGPDKQYQKTSRKIETRPR